jgi:hypothetical protein
MNAPKRWLDGGAGLEPGTTDLLRSGLDLDPPPGAHDAVWGALAAKIGPVAGGGGAGPADPGTSAVTAKAGAAAKSAVAAKSAGAAKAAAASGGVMKALLLGVIAGGVSVAGYSVVAPSREPAPVVAAPVEAPAPKPLAAPPLPAPRPGLAADAPAPAPAPAPADPPAVAQPSAARAPSIQAAPALLDPASPSLAANPPPPAPALVDAPADPAAAQAERQSRLREESQMVAGARGLLRGGQAVAALARLEEARAKFPGGVLGQEREALSIEALAESGQRAVARERARAFLRAWPSSPHAPRLAPFAD